MPYKNKNQEAENKRLYYRQNSDAIKRKVMERYWNNYATERPKKTASNAKRKEKNNERERLRYRKLREQVILHYGGVCACCGEKEFLFLEIDHINGGGNKHRNEIGRSAMALIKWIIENDYPPEFQVLCANCNQGKKRNGGICPHKGKP